MTMRIWPNRIFCEADGNAEAALLRSHAKLSAKGALGAWSQLGGKTRKVPGKSGPVLQSAVI